MYPSLQNVIIHDISLRHVRKLISSSVTYTEVQVTFPRFSFSHLSKWSNSFVCRNVSALSSIDFWDDVSECNGCVDVYAGTRITAPNVCPLSCIQILACCRLRLRHIYEMTSFSWYNSSCDYPNSTDMSNLLGSFSPVCILSSWSYLQTYR